MSPMDSIRSWMQQSPVNRLIAGLVLVFVVQTLLESAGWLLGWPAEQGIISYLSFTASLLETLWPPTRILRLFAVGVFVGGLGAWLAGIWRPAFVVGASAGVYAVFTAAAVRMPDFKVRLFMVLELKLWVVLAVLLGMDVIGLFAPDTTARAAHLAGAAAGWFYSARPHLLDLAARRTARRSAPKSPLSVVRPQDPSLDQLLDKISAKGYESLTANERKLLARYSQKK